MFPFDILKKSRNLNRQLQILTGSESEFKDFEQLIDKGFNYNNHVYSIVNRIATVGSDLPFKLTNTLRDGTEEVVSDGDFFSFLNSPNEQDNYKDFIYKLMVFQLITGNALAYGVKGFGANYISELNVLATQFIEPKTIETVNGYEATKYNYNFGTKNYSFDKEEVMHLKRFNPNYGDDSSMGLSPLQSAYRVLSASNDVMEADAALIKNKGVLGFISSKGDRPATETDGVNLDNALRRRIGGSGKFGGVAVTGGNFDFVKMSMSPTDLKILENGVFKLRDLCSIYGAKSRMFNDPQGASFNNNKQDTKDFYLNAVLPPLNLTLNAISDFVVSGWNERDNANYKISVDTSSIEALQEDKQLEAQKSKTILEGVNVVLNMPIGEAGKIELLMSSYGMSEASAQLIVNNEQND